MLNICTDTLPQTCLSYIAFRLALLETMKLTELAQRLPAPWSEPYGYLTEVPFLREVAPKVQIAILAETWRKHLAPDTFEADLLEEAVVYAVCETAARVVERLPELVPAYLSGGPLDISVPVDHVLAADLRSLHLQLQNEGDFLLVSQLQDFSPEEAAEFKEQFGLRNEALEPLFDVLGQWHVPGDLSASLSGLLTAAECSPLPRWLLPLSGESRYEQSGPESRGR